MKLRFRRRQHRHFSRRRALLTSLGVMWALYGWSIYTAPAISAAFGRQIGVLFYLASHWTGLIWLAGGGTAVVVGLARRHKWEPLGFNCLLIPPLLWTLLSIWAWVVSLATHGEYGAHRGWVSAEVWSAGVAVVLITSGWVDHFDAHVMPELDLPLPPPPDVRDD